MPASLHIISFDIPYPANYGGIIDVFYKIVALHRAGVSVHLHCYHSDRKTSDELEKYCHSVYYYPRRTGFLVNLGITPYIVAGRISEDLVNRLTKDQFPILFEGLHTCGIMKDKRLENRMMIYRESNIEHHYYYHLFKAERNIWKRSFFLIESARLRLFQNVLKKASVMLTVSQGDTDYLASKFPGNRVLYLPSFHKDDTVRSIPGQGNYALYQGKLSVPENYRAAAYLIEKVWQDDLPDLIIAGLEPPGWLHELAKQHPNVSVVGNPAEEEMFELIRGAHVNIMVTFQPTGLKLKLLNALFNGRFCLVNPEMIAGTSLEKLCRIAGNPGEFVSELRQLFSMPFTTEEISQRVRWLERYYSNQNNCNLLMQALNLC